MEKIVLFLSTTKGKVLVVGLFFILAVFFAAKSQVKKKKVMIFDKERIRREKEKKGL